MAFSVRLTGYCAGHASPTLEMEIPWWPSEVLRKDPRMVRSNETGSYQDYDAFRSMRPGGFTRSTNRRPRPASTTVRNGNGESSPRFENWTQLSPRPIRPLRDFISAYSSGNQDWGNAWLNPDSHECVGALKDTSTCLTAATHPPQHADGLPENQKDPDSCCCEWKDRPKPGRAGKG